MQNKWNIQHTFMKHLDKSNLWFTRFLRINSESVFVLFFYYYFKNSKIQKRAKTKTNKYSKNSVHSLHTNISFKLKICLHSIENKLSTRKLFLFENHEDYFSRLSSSKISRTSWILLKLFNYNAFWC